MSVFPGILSKDAQAFRQPLLEHHIQRNVIFEDGMGRGTGGSDHPNAYNPQFATNSIGIDTMTFAVQ